MEKNHIKADTANATATYLCDLHNFMNQEKAGEQQTFKSQDCNKLGTLWGRDKEIVEPTTE